MVLQRDRKQGRKREKDPSVQKNPFEGKNKTVGAPVYAKARPKKGIIERKVRKKIWLRGKEP